MVITTLWNLLEKLDPQELNRVLLGGGEVRNVALNCLRRLGLPYIPDARRAVAAQSKRGLYLLLQKPAS